MITRLSSHLPGVLHFAITFPAVYFFLSTLCIPLTCYGHQYTDFDHSIGISITPSQVTLEYRVWFGPVLIPGFNLDINSNSELDQDELFEYLAEKEQQIGNNLQIQFNNQHINTAPISSTIATDGRYPNMTLEMAIWYRGQLPFPENTENEFTITDNNYPGYGPERKLFYLNVDSAVTNLSVVKFDSGRKLIYTTGTGMRSGNGPNFSTARVENSASDPEGSLTNFLRKEKLSPLMLLIAFGSAFFLGSAHALSPGHGKAMVAAYLVGTSGRKRDAITLGIIVTFTHVISVLLLGLVLLYLSSRVLPEQIYPWLSALSGCMIFAVGLFLLLRSLRANLRSSSHDHNHAPHHHDHHQHPGSDHTTPVGRAGLLSLLSLGIAGGMVPCPSAIVVLLASVSLQKIALGLALILVFSLGLASVLIVIGLLIVSISGISVRLIRLEKAVKILPLCSAVIVIFLGLFLIISTLVESGIVSINLP